MSQSLDPIIPKSLMEAILSSFQVQATTAVELLGATAIAPGRDPHIDIAATIGIRSSGYSGILALCFPQATFLGVINKMLAEQYQAINEENSDAAGELLNIIYGSARVKFNDGGHDFSPAIPTVVFGNDINISHGSTPLVVRINCRCEFGPFSLEISLRHLNLS